MDCPNCGGECWRTQVDIGVGVISGPYGCPNCGWSEWSEYDARDGLQVIDGWTYDQWGAMYRNRKPEEEK